MALAEEELAELARRVGQAAANAWPGATVDELVALRGGVSSLTFASTIVFPGNRRIPIVVKVAPPGLAPVRNRDVLRQARILRKLQCQPGIPTPGVLLEDDSAPPLFVMERLVGQSYEPKLDVSPDPPAPHVVAERARAACRVLARIHSVDPFVVGEQHEPVLMASDELDRWAKLFDTVDPDICPTQAALRDDLAAGVPDPAGPALVHGDYRLANMIFDGPELRGIIDWEIWSVGDPRGDLAWILMHTDPLHRFAEQRGPGDIAAGAGMPSLAVLLDEYTHELAILDGDPATATRGLEWWIACSYYKTAATLGVFIKRNRRLADPDRALQIASDSLDDVIARGAEVLAHYRRGATWRR